MPAPPRRRESRRSSSLPSSALLRWRPRVLPSHDGTTSLHLGPDFAGELFRLDARHPEGAAERDGIAHEVEPGRVRVLLAPVDDRIAALVEHAEVADEPLEAGSVARRGDYDVGIDSRAVPEHGVALLEALER